LGTWSEVIGDGSLVSSILFDCDESYSIVIETSPILTSVWPVVFNYIYWKIKGISSTKLNNHLAYIVL